MLKNLPKLKAAPCTGEAIVFCNTKKATFKLSVEPGTAWAPIPMNIRLANLWLMVCMLPNTTAGPADCLYSPGDPVVATESQLRAAVDSGLSRPCVWLAGGVLINMTETLYILRPITIGSAGALATLSGTLLPRQPEPFIDAAVDSEAHRIVTIKIDNPELWDAPDAEKWVTISDIIFTGGLNGALFVASLEFKHVTLERCVFHHNGGASGLGGAVYVTYPWNSETLSKGSITTTDCEFSDNLAFSGAAVYIDADLSTVSFTRTTFSRNQATLEGGGLWLRMRVGGRYDKTGGLVQLIGCTLLDNSAFAVGTAHHDFGDYVPASADYDLCLAAKPEWQVRRSLHFHPLVKASHAVPIHSSACCMLASLTQHVEQGWTCAAGEEFCDDPRWNADLKECCPGPQTNADLMKAS